MVVPAIIPDSINHLRESLEKLEEVTVTFQVDIVDGNFVPFTSWPYQAGQTIEEAAVLFLGHDIELDLMILRPEEALEKWLNTGASRIVIHIESTQDVKGCIKKIQARGKEVGLSLLNDTELESLDPYINEIDFVQCMGIKEIGMQGNSFDERVLDRIKEIKTTHPKLEVSVDGSVNSKTIKKMHTAGASRFISGSALYRAKDPIAAYKELSALVS